MSSPPAPPGVVSSVGLSFPFDNNDEVDVAPTPLPPLPEALVADDDVDAVAAGVEGASKVSRARIRWARLSRSWSCCSSPEDAPLSAEVFECAPSIVFALCWGSRRVLFMGLI